MRMDKLTARLQEALSDAQSLAVGQGNSTIEPVHLTVSYTHLTLPTIYSV